LPPRPVFATSACVFYNRGNPDSKQTRAEFLLSASGKLKGKFGYHINNKAHAVKNR
jgi:hypothetical protein